MNQIDMGNKNTEIGLRLANGLTGVLISVLGLSGSRLAKSYSEKIMIIWLLEHDQSCCGLGNVSFCLSEMPWKEKEFSALKNFVVCVIEDAMKRVGWETLNYVPNEELLFPKLCQLKEMFLLLDSSDIDYEKAGQWSVDSDIYEGDWEKFPAFTQYQLSRNDLRLFPKCAKHDMLLTIFGCHACNELG